MTAIDRSTVTGRPRPDDGRPVAPSRTDRVVRSLSQAIGGPLGRHGRNPPRRRFWIPIRVVLLAAVIMAGLAWLQKYPCADGGWTDFQQYTQYCYSDIRALWGAERLDQGAVPYFDHPVEYPALTGVFMGIFGLASHALLGAGGGTLYYHLSAVVLLGFGVAAVASVYRMRPGRPFDAMMLAVAPMVLLTAGVNWDLLAVGLTCFFLAAFARGRVVAAGVLWGLAVAAKFYPLLIAGPLLLLAWRHRRLGPALSATGIAAATWLLVNLPFMLWAPDGWRRFFELNSERGIDWGTSWYILRHFAEVGGGLDSALQGLGAAQGWLYGTLNHVDTLNWLYLVAFVLCCSGIAWLALFAAEPPRLAQLVFLVVATFLLTGKVWSQQYVLWLIPLAVLARPKWRLFLVWQVGELLYFFGFYSELLTVSESQDSPAPAWGLVIPEWVFVMTSIARFVTLTILVVAVVRDVLDPARDVVRRTYRGDPDAGPLLPAGGPASVTVRTPPPRRGR
ncbi:putative membrane protein [Stackebrandtia albiflava]|uniref:Putative membrane protein n=1 Tax=Stackebrandtia albiflava TaxID=406432 RepID=A0A562V157_9ACTN|nr:glycosyltransferase 87 family protein [Stackebrandtia albiflava]TWJ11604.1 putative membrane protein [Stackebrandtia albiflava]